MIPTFQIDPLTTELNEDLQRQLDQKTKPPGALGRLEHLAFHIGRIQQTLKPVLTTPTVVVFAGDHGITDEGVSAYPRDVTQQMVLNFLAGGAAINVFARQHGMSLYVVDAGVDADFDAHEQLLSLKIARGTRNFRHEAAMTEEQCQQAIERGAEVVRKMKHAGCNVIMFGEMGIGNTSSASVLLSLLGNLPIDGCVGRGTGLDDSKLNGKKRILHDAIRRHGVMTNPFTALATFGGFEIAMMCGAFLQAAAERMVILVDGFITSSALLTASTMQPAVLDYCLFAHLSDEPGHRAMLDALNAEPLLHLNMRLGEGTGAAVAYPLIQSAVNVLNEMASFESAGVSTAS